MSPKSYNELGIRIKLRFNSITACTFKTLVGPKKTFELAPNPLTALQRPKKVIKKGQIENNEIKVLFQKKG